MGLLDGITSVFKTAGNIIEKAGAALIHPVQSYKQGVSAVVEQQRKQTLGESIKEGAIAITGYGTALLAPIGAGTTAGAAAVTSLKTGAGNIAKSVGSSVTTWAAANKLKAVGVGFAGIAATGAVIQNPSLGKAAGKEIIKSPVTAYDIGSDLGNLTKNPSLSNAAGFVKKHPIATGATALLTGLGLVKGLAPIYAASQLDELGNNKQKIEINNPNGTIPPITEDTIEEQQKLTKLQSKADLDLIEAQTKAQLKLIEAQTEQQEALIKAQTQAAAVQTPSPAAAPTKKKTTKKKTTKKKTTKKKTAKKKPTKKVKKRSSVKKKAKK